MVKKEDFKYHKIGREVAIYKMHGDKDSPDDVVLTKEDYQNYDIDRGIFTRMLSVELIRKSFVFIGFSFNDPNLERILSIAKQTLQGKAPQTHYCFMRKVQLIEMCIRDRLMGYYVSVAKGLDVDKPRNLAKSVTVE